MKKICLMFGLMIAPMHGYAAQVALGNSGSNLNSVMPGALGVSGMTNPAAGYYYKCTNSVPFSGCETNAILVSYTSQTGGAGTSVSPYVLTGCSFLGCACAYNSYLSGNQCKNCSNNTEAVTPRQYHRNTSCDYCDASMLMLHPAQGVTICVACPANGTCDGTESLKCNKGYYGTNSCSQCPATQYQSCVGSFGTTDAAGAQNITDCYIAANGSFCDETGQGVFTDKCSYTN